MARSSTQFVSRGGEKLLAALQAFDFQVQGMTCADLGCNVGGFTDCLLQHGADRVFAVDTGYGQLAWKLRQHPRVIVMERTNALHTLPDTHEHAFTGADLVTIDLAWTRQQHAIPAAIRWLKSDVVGHVITLIKPHYEQAILQTAQTQRGILTDDQAHQVAQAVIDQLPCYGVRVVDWTASPIRGGKGKGKAGNREYLALLQHDPP